MGKSLVLGFFDGIHKAHRAVINSAFKYSDEVVVVTFCDSPSLYFNNTSEYIMSRNDSVAKIKSMGVRDVILQDFSEIAKIPAENYVERLVEIHHPKAIISGYNHTFGFNKQGNPKMLEQLSSAYNYKYECVEKIVENGEVVSSTLVKDYLKRGNVEYANFLLESNFVLEGIVIHGAELGRTIGFPTANMNYPKNIVRLPYGSYCATVDGKKSVMNWGMKPTVNNTVEPIIEVHILDFEGDLYGQDIRIDVLKQIRSERKFNNLDELKKQINKDVEECLKL